MAKLCVLACILFALVVGCGKSGTISRSPAQFQSDNNLRAISKLVLEYRRKHNGASPERLSDIVSDEQLGFLEMFYLTGEGRPALRPEFLTDRGLLDEHASYALPVKTDSKVLACERPGLWPDGTAAVCFEDSTITRMDASDYKATVGDVPPVSR